LFVIPSYALPGSSRPLRPFIIWPKVSNVNVLSGKMAATCRGVGSPVWGRAAARVGAFFSRLRRAQSDRETAVQVRGRSRFRALPESSALAFLRRNTQDAPSRNEEWLGSFGAGG